MLKYKILIKLFVLNCVFVCCVYVDTMVLCLLVSGEQQRQLYEYISVNGDRIPVGARFSASFQTGIEAHPASCTMGTGSFPGVKRPGRGVDHSSRSSAVHQSTLSRGSAQRRYFKEWLINTYRSCNI
jgi:hypothetical protein